MVITNFTSGTMDSGHLLTINKSQREGKLFLSVRNIKNIETCVDSITSLLYLFPAH